MAQSINLPAIAYTPYVRVCNPSLAVPHFSVKDISQIDPDRLKSSGITGLVFDKDNTITAPYKNEIHPAIKDSFNGFMEAFDGKIVIMSNSAGTRDDRGYSDAAEIEESLGIPVLKHSWKKPAGGTALKKYFRSRGLRDLSEMAMFGDRLLTDIVFGNRYGLLTIHTAKFTEEGDNPSAANFRKKEINWLLKLQAKGIRAPPHKLYDPAIQIKG